jgi:tetratricopeptide (TPR) repeat protein
MIRLILILLLACLPVGATAQKIVVRSGEHGDFSRLAFSFSAPVEWKMGRVSGGYEIRLKGNGNVIDTSGVFRRISRDRIKDISVSEDNSNITLTVDCACHADAFEFRPGLLVVDIKDGLPAQSSPFETAFSADETGAVITDEKAVATADETDREADETGKENGSVTEDVVIIDQEAEPVPLPVPAYSSSFTSGLALRPEIGSGNSERITMMQSEMLRQIGRAAAQGLLEANLPVPIHEPKPTDTHESMADPSETQQEAPKEPAAQAHINIHIENSVDREIARLLPKRTALDGGDVCFASELVNIAEWGGEDAVWEQISQQRRKLSGEFDKANPVAAEALAKAYIYAGFGAEALQVIDSFGVDPETALILQDIARIVDGLSPQPNGVLRGQAACYTEVAMWAVLALSELSKGTDVNRPRVIATFSELPLHLRRYLGPKLAEMFLEIGDIETATAIRNAIARAPGYAGDEFRLMEAHFEQERGRHDTAEHTLEEIATENNAVALKALIKLLEAKAERKSQVSDEIMTTAESYLFEQRTTSDGAKLLRSLTLIYAQSGNLDIALSNLRAANTNTFINEKTQLWVEVLTTATNSASDEAFLKFIFAADKDISKLDVPQTTRQAMAKRVLDLVFSTRALDILNTPVSPSDTDRLIMAKAALLDGRADQVEGLLENVSGDEAINLRAQAFENLGYYEKAAAGYAEISDYDSQKSVVWQAGDWQSLQQIGTEPEKLLARSMALGEKISDANPAISEQVLSVDASLIEESGNFRQSIEALIKDYPAPFSVDD